MGTAARIFIGAVDIGCWCFVQVISRRPGRWVVEAIYRVMQ